MSEGHEHAKRYAPSAAHRWTVCHASARFNEQFVSESSTYAQDGTEAHGLFAFALSNRMRTAIEAKVVYPSPWIHREDTEADRLDSVQAALDYVYFILEAHPDAILYVETRVDFNSPYTNDCWGHADVIIWMPSLSTIEVVDFKHGAGEVVEAVNNKQLGIYGGASYQFAKRQGHAPKTLVMTIIQPRVFHSLGSKRHWVVSDAFMDNMFIPEINAHILQCEDEGAAFTPGKKQCKWCPGSFHCKAREAAALAAVPAQLGSFQNVTVHSLPPVRNLPIDKLVWIVNASKLLKDYMKEAAAALQEAAIAGAHVPGKKLVESSNERKWYGNELDVARELMKLLDTEDWDSVYPRQLIGITDAEKRIVTAFKRKKDSKSKKDNREAAELAKQAMALLTLKTGSGKLTLVDEDDPRPPADASRHQFAGITLIEPPKGS